VALTRAILGLEDAITMDVLFYRRDPDRGWQFKPEVWQPAAAQLLMCWNIYYGSEGELSAECLEYDRSQDALLTLPRAASALSESCTSVRILRRSRCAALHYYLNTPPVSLPATNLLHRTDCWVTASIF
jgi:hypothetical protein